MIGGNHASENNRWELFGEAWNSTQARDIHTTAAAPGLQGVRFFQCNSDSCGDSKQCEPEYKASMENEVYVSPRPHTHTFAPGITKLS